MPPATTSQSLPHDSHAPHDHASLIRAVRQGLQPDYLFFWGHSAKAGAPVGKECLSQWWPASFCVDGQTYASAEHFMMAGKARLFGDAQAWSRVLAASTPAAAKQVGREVRGFDAARWDAVCLGLVTQGNIEKFRQDPALAGYLLGTGERVLVEASPVDRVWGIGLAADDPRAGNPEQWRGPNLLGFALMAAREALRDASAR
ncbi:NADAR family protein [Cupriavidus sp. CV2]|uniref:NADAR family protein n=1 Tax=Cupriavidus ulmosensis TaxID=3065913 RepID=UPI00296AEA22|nr:NADAR family protein [Cupriavidus sp. CV2]MDW3687877.1 NADAR family protein [Cupriavidus sp. CV2]